MKNPLFNRAAHIPELEFKDYIIFAKSQQLLSNFLIYFLENNSDYFLTHNPSLRQIKAFNNILNNKFPKLNNDNFIDFINEDVFNFIKQEFIHFSDVDLYKLLISFIEKIIFDKILINF